MKHWKVNVHKCVPVMLYQCGALTKVKDNVKLSDFLTEFSRKCSPQNGACRDLDVVTFHYVTRYVFKDGGSQCQVVCCETLLVILTVTVCQTC